MGYPATPVPERFAAKYEPCLMSGCWLWLDAPDQYGYGRLQINNRAAKAHRVSWELVNGEIPDGLLVCHRCDTPSCVNPAHLFLGTDAQNSADMMAKGRHRPGGKPHPGERNPRAKLLEYQVVSILERQARGERINAAAEARALGVKSGSIIRLLNGQAWAHLPRTVSKS